MNKNEASKIAQSFFKSYPSVGQFFITQDGQAFEEENNAQAHATSLNKKEPVVFSVEKNEAPEPVVELTEEEKADKAAADAKAQEEKEAAAAEKRAKKAAAKVKK